MKAFYKKLKHIQFHKKKAGRLLKRSRKCNRKSIPRSSTPLKSAVSSSSVHQITRIRDLKAVLKDFEAIVKNPKFLRTGRDFRNFLLRPREAWANWLLCVVGNYEANNNDLTFATDPTGGDGLIISRKTNKFMRTEHVFAPTQKNRFLTTAEVEIERAINHKVQRGSCYAKDKQLVVFSDANGSWTPNTLAKKVVGTHGFDAIWIVALKCGGATGYIYNVSEMNVTQGNAPIWEVRISAAFDNWEITRTQ